MGRVLTSCLVGTILRALRLFRVAVFAGAAVLGGLLSILGGLGTVGPGLEPVQGCLVALVGSGVTSRGRLLRRNSRPRATLVGRSQRMDDPR